jgi:hypothetical protein
MNSKIIILGIIITAISLTSVLSTTPLIINQAANAAAWTDPDPTPRKAPPVISGDNVYVTWWTNNTANKNNNNEEVIFRASTDGGVTFGDKINLSNSTNADSTRAEIDSDANSVLVTWWETNQTSDVPVMRVSNDSDEIFGPLLNLASN